MSYQQATYSYIPNVFIDDIAKTLPLGETRVLLCFYRHAIEIRGAEIRPCTSFLSDKTGLTANEVEKSVQSLISKKLIEEVFPDCYSLTSEGR